MKKHIMIEIEACDICKENEVGRYYHGGMVTCDWCGKVLCNKCKKELDNFTICPVCEKEKLTEYYKLIGKMNALEIEYEKIKTESEEELRRINSLRLKQC
ncbi:MAG TPA: hypothetical protein DF296_15075 [Candidatus Margulisbacteria bacterium]|nr:hypothetical protein [Candidatus Margulisiibacteriota bacterium]